MLEIVCAGPQDIQGILRMRGIALLPSHLLRDTIAILGERLCRSPEEFKAWSQNMAHKKVLTTLINYGNVGLDRQQEIMRGLDKPKEPLPDFSRMAADIESLKAQIGKGG